MCCWKSMRWCTTSSLVTQYNIILGLFRSCLCCWKQITSIRSHLVCATGLQVPWTFTCFKYYIIWYQHTIWPKFEFQSFLSFSSRALGSQMPHHLKQVGITHWTPGLSSTQPPCYHCLWKKPRGSRSQICINLQLSQLEVRTLIQFLMSSSRGTFFDVGNKCQNPISLQLTGRQCFVG